MLGAISKTHSTVGGAATSISVRIGWDGRDIKDIG